MPSTVVAHSHYDEVTATLRITYVSGAVYDYKDVPKQVYDDMKSSGSKGIFLNLHIKGHYAFEQVR
jgi:hypothetical protein